MAERWKPVCGYEGMYEVSDAGRVRSVERCVVCKNGTTKRLSGRAIAASTDRNGYLSVLLSKEGNQRRLLVHRMVALAFIPNPNKYAEINHKDECKANNSVANLEWCDRSYNNGYGTLPLRKQKRFGKPVRQILNGETVAIYPSASAAARATGGTQGGISGCCRGELKASGGYQWELIV